jgi:hypothetical protein
MNNVDVPTTTAQSTDRGAEPTFGCILGTGEIVEQLAAGMLAVWRHGAEAFGPVVEAGLRTFAPQPLHPSLSAAVRFPVESLPYISEESLFEEICSLFTRYLPSLPKHAADLMAGYVMGTWVSDLLATRPVLHVSAAPGHDRVLLDLFSALCRRALPLHAFSMSEVAKLPERLHPTLVVPHPGARGARDIRQACASPGSFRLHAGQCLQVAFNAVVLGRSDDFDGALSISVPKGTGYRRLSPYEAEEIARRYQPQLLRFRFIRHHTVGASAVDVPQLSPALRIVAHSVLAPLEGIPNLRARLIRGLVLEDEQKKNQLAHSAEGALAEVLLALTHEGQHSITVGELSHLVEALAHARGTGGGNAKQVGAMVRNFGLRSRRTRHGYVVELDRAGIHGLARQFGALATPGVSPCRECEEAAVSSEVCDDLETVGEAHPQAIGEEGSPNDVYTSSDHSDVHHGADVHYVHDVHADAATTRVSQASPAQPLEMKA